MFAFGIWDVQAQNLTLCRDRIGKKPLFYMPLRQGIAFASDTIGATHKKVNSQKRSLNNEGSPGSP
jgi:asparagine synthetase B (glutamine-hydrolysing)